MKTVFSLLLLFWSCTLLGQSVRSEIDVQHYFFRLQLSDQSDLIRGNADLSIRFLQPVSSFAIDLVQKKGDGKGMVVQRVDGEGVEGFRQQNDQLVVLLKKDVQKNDVLRFSILYSGVPDDGMIISRNKFGDRTFFSDNWPNRAHHWIPCNDVPSDKASFEFEVVAPAHYQVISNGQLVDQKDTLMEEAGRVTHWKEDIPLPSKVMVIGVARFAVKQYSEGTGGIPVSAWVFPQDSTKGFYDYGLAPGILAFFSNYIGPFPYNKLANVQSKTIFGGMENASCIFYAEESVTGDRKWEEVIAHEIAHQWFGDMASEKSFAHLWLSEGFATYLTDLYFEKNYGKENADKRLQKERSEVIDFLQKTHHPVVDSTHDLMSLLNANSYQKGGWVLHMLRQVTGDSSFQKIIQTYYSQFKGSNADTRDFEAVAEKVSGKDLRWFFDQWLYRSGLPEVDVTWKMEKGGVRLCVAQVSKEVFRFPLTIGYRAGGKWFYDVVNVAKKGERFFIKTDVGQVDEVVLDPHTELLFKGRVGRIR